MKILPFWRDLRALRWWRLIGILLVLVIIFLSLQPNPMDMSGVEFGDKWGHLVAYGTLMAWFGLIVVRSRQIWFASVFVLLGVSLEFIQGQTGYRSFDLMDMAANSLGVMLGYGLCATRFRYTLHYLESRMIPTT